ncbi:hypothetical protein [Methylobacterium nigriterrae]|uniref:hypothetical protein n=1 Tax=Methylobacterium nigriterrae TaxID=3127512 RepID=UPI00301410F6
MGDADKLTILALATENAELRGQLADAQDLLVETAIDAGQMHARIEALEARLAQAERERDAWRAEAGRAERGAA